MFFKLLLMFVISIPLFSKGVPIMLQIQSKESVPIDFRDGVEETLTEMNFSLVDQKAQEEALKEQTEQREKGCYDDECLVDTGKMLAARGLIVVEVDERDESTFRFKFRYVDFETGTTTKTKMTYFNFSLSKYKELYEFGKSITKELFSDKIETEKSLTQQKVIPQIENDKNTKEIEDKNLTKKQNDLDLKKNNSNQENSIPNTQILLLYPKHDKLKLSLGLKGGINTSEITFMDDNGYENWESFDGGFITLDFEIIYNIQEFLGFYALASFGTASIESFERGETNDQSIINLFVGVRGDYFINFSLSVYFNFGIGFSKTSLTNTSNENTDSIDLSGPAFELESGITYFNSLGEPIFDLGLGVTSMQFKDYSLEGITDAYTTLSYLSFRYYFMSK
ncbi:hypothetical protein JXR93_01185 [bacterium]|nr:hypothetical protein [bacterium]